MSEVSAVALVAAVSSDALCDEVLRSTWPQRRAERVETFEQLVAEVVFSEFMTGGHFIPITGNVTALGRDEATASNRVRIVAAFLDGKKVCTRGQLLVKHFFNIWSDEPLDVQLDSLSRTTLLDIVRIDAHRHADTDEVMLHWRRL